ncbi:urease accessory protein UreF [Verrucosispora sioxanthis]|uniref:urease accessory protein UreF n=1 Tax=Verrucosispora sioxanthis TaxID=2499994 RepID=UPI002E2B037B|nr:urease accessory UreF family protein [Verrucosispora sioxanthis]
MWWWSRIRWPNYPWPSGTSCSDGRHDDAAAPRRRAVSGRCARAFGRAGGGRRRRPGDRPGHAGGVPAGSAGHRGTCRGRVRGGGPWCGLVGGPGRRAGPARRRTGRRTASPAQRSVSRRQGRALLRAGRRIWPAVTFDDLPAAADGPHQPLVLGLVGAAAGLDPGQVATVAAHATVTGAASAAVRLLGLDPYQVQALLVRLAGACDATAARAARAADEPPERLPAAAAPLADIHAEAHVTWEVRLFAS